MKVNVSFGHVKICHIKKKMKKNYCVFYSVKKTQNNRAVYLKHFTFYIDHSFWFKLVLLILSKSK